MYRLAPCLLLVALATASAPAQVVNVERLRLDGTEPGWSGSLTGNADLRRNQRSVFSLGANAHLQHRRDSNTALLVGQAGIVQTSGDDLVNFGFSHLRYTHFVSEWLSLEAFTQLQVNRVNGIASRWLVGAGPRFRVADEEAAQLYVGATVVREREREVVDSIPVHRDVRLSAYFAGSYTPASAAWITVASTTYFQPRLGRFADIRISSDTDLSVQLRANLSLVTTFNVVYDARPPVGLERTTYAILNGLKFVFGS